MFTDSLLMAPQNVSKPMVTWIPLLLLPKDETWTKPRSLAKTRMLVIHTSILPTANHDAEVERLCHVLLLHKDALKQTAPCLQWAAYSGVSQLQKNITTTDTARGIGMGSAGAGQPTLTRDPLSRSGQFRG